jgi:hypothetical protein
VNDRASESLVGVCVEEHCLLLFKNKKIVGQIPGKKKKKIENGLEGMTPTLPAPSAT